MDNKLLRKRLERKLVDEYVFWSYDRCLSRLTTW